MKPIRIAAFLILFSIAGTASAWNPYYAPRHCHPYYHPRAVVAYGPGYYVRPAVIVVGPSRGAYCIHHEWSRDRDRNRHHRMEEYREQR
jgi:hypothetical protein